MARISIKDVRLEFQLFRDKGLRFKEWLINFLTFKRNENVIKFDVLSGINLEFNVGDRAAIFGLNGAGKTTLMKLIAGIYHPTEGSVEVEGRLTPLLETGTGFNPELTGRENIIMNGAFFGQSRKKMEPLIENIIEFSGLREFIDSPIKYYSTGMVSRLAFTIATNIDPEILIVDEVFAAGDHEFIGRASAKMKSLFDESKIVLFVSHSVDLCRELCNRGVWISKGIVRMDGDIGEVVEAYLHSGEHLGQTESKAAV
ncbi:MAG: ABC transporter ATP-binding protein [Planctomycetes bacterium]|nr:ABC transporter ATP-binding protein [Planctomycetota bacterium]